MYVPRYGYMPEIFCSEKDGKIYVYRSTSEYDPDSHSKVSKSEYIGR